MLSRDSGTPRVVGIFSDLRRYRVTFFEMLRERLAENGVTFDLLYSSSPDPKAHRGDEVDLPWAHRVPERELKLGRYELTWQPYHELIRSADLVIVQQATRRLLNYLLLARQLVGGPRVAFWGHGRNFQATSAVQSGGEFLKRIITRQAHWFFAYNDLSAEVLDQLGYPSGRVTVIGNSIDTRALAASRDRVTEEDRQELRRQLGLDGDHIAIYCGGMYPEKRLEFLVSESREIRSRVPDFELVLIGAGPDMGIVEAAAEENSWIHYVGPQFGDDLARHFAVARIFLMPGSVGLVVLDSFVLGVPLLTTSDPLHGPEIAYLEDGFNGVMVPGDGSDGSFVGAAVKVLTDDSLHARLVTGCRESAELYSVESMVDRFATGVIEALGRLPSAVEST